MRSDIPLQEPADCGIIVDRRRIYGVGSRHKRSHIPA
ncbi:hypothetical protein PHMEG_00033166 [Phytophthora megakarya]|uniref:Uncharacterized protein n=1 Tax=Phytophthora megakarya TaxID=4795 RepID=A0A225UUA5_9STRA|nr:hypothetical protein PHMEG_00033166 [Phytophthora megakarya]